ncbi:MAG: GntR family transcriptional regulator [Alphaproteobacteria bacterium]|nr:GntR family transcriptional regulator [Alphaproteobacteria bacterium]
MNINNNKTIEYLRSVFEARAVSEIKYENLANAFKVAIDDEVLLPGASLPGERKLAELLGISRITVRHAIDALVSDGQLVRRHGARTSVAAKVGKQISNLLGFSEDMRSRGIEPGMRLLSAETTNPTEQERQMLKLADGESVVRLRRVRLGNERPIALETAVVPSVIVKSPEAIGLSLYATLDALGALPERGVQRITAKTMSAEEAELLETEVGAPALIVERCCGTALGKPIEFTVTCYNAEVFDFVTDLQR